MRRWGRTGLSGRITGLAGAALLVVTGVSCAAGVEYDMPDEICGEDYSPDTLADLLPGGKELVDREIPVVSGSFICYIEVDSTLVVTYEIATAPAGGIAAPSELEGSRHLDEFTRARPVDVGDEAVVGDRGASAMAACPGQGEGAVLRLDVVLPGDHGEQEDYTEQREHLEEFLRDFFPVVARSDRCSLVGGDGTGGMAMPATGT